jgi:RNA polymerase primary sigma factor
MQTRATQPDPFELYIRDLETAVPLSAEEETEHAQRIQDARATLWGSVLAYAPLNGAISAVLRERFEGEEVQTAASVLAEASRSARATRTAAGGQALHAAVDAVVTMMLPLDQDDVVLMTIAQDAETLVSGRRADLTLNVKRLPSLGKPFTAYVARVAQDAEALRTAKMAFAQANLRLVVHMARRFERSPVALTDLIQEGNLGLMRAVDRFDHTRGFRFSTYAAWWIRHSLNRAVRNTGRLVRVPVHVFERQREIARTRSRLEETLDGAPSDLEVAEALGLPEHKVRRNDAAIAAYSRSIDAPTSGDEGATLSDVLADEDAPFEEHVEWAQLGERLSDAMGELDAVERDILQRRYGLAGCRNETLREVGERYGLSRERIRQLQARALGKMRDALSA